MNAASLLQCLIPEALLVGTALLLLSLSAAKRIHARGSQRIAAFATLLALVLMTRETSYLESNGGLILVDPLALGAKSFLLILGFLALLLPAAPRETDHPAEYHALMLFALTGLMLATGTQHLLMLFIALELGSLSLYLLAGFSRTPRAAEASLKYFLFGAVSAAFVWFGLSLLYGFSGGATLPEIAARLSSSDPTLAFAGLAMLLTGLAFKLAVAPFHAWAPDVYQGSPATSVSLVAGASKVAAIVVLMRVLATGFDTLAGSASWGEMSFGSSMWLAVLAAVSMIFGNLLALAQHSVRRLLAYSAIANAGYLLVGLSANSSASLAAVLSYAVIYSLATLGAVAIIAAVERDRGDDRRTAFDGLVHRSPLLAISLLVCFASLAGLPPLAGFVGKFALFTQSLAADTTDDGAPGLTWLVALAVVTSAVSLRYYLTVLKHAFARGVTSENEFKKIPFEHALAVGLPVLALVVVGCFPSCLFDPVVRAVSSLTGH